MRFEGWHMDETTHLEQANAEGRELRRQVNELAERVQELEDREYYLQRLAVAALTALPEEAFDPIRDRVISGEFDQ